MDSILPPQPPSVPSDLNPPFPPVSNTPSTTGDPADLRGPWVAVLADPDGFRYRTVADARDELGLDGEVEISVRRGTIAYRIDCDLDGDGVDQWWAQAQAMAAGLNGVVDHG
jgi:hypothetical protein